MLHNVNLSIFPFINFQKNKSNFNMCITFFYINSKCAGKDAFRFILIFNRDEFYERETSFAHFWQESPSVIGGR